MEKIEYMIFMRHLNSKRAFIENIEKIIENNGLYDYIKTIYGCNFLVGVLAGKKIFIDFQHAPNGFIQDERIDVSQMLIDKHLKKQDIAIDYNTIKCYLNN